MTVQTTTSVATGIGNDVTTVFPFNFKLTSETDLVVLDVTTADETYTELTLGSDYTVQGVGSENGGSITLATPLPSGHEVKMARELDILQQTDLRNQGKFFAETHEDVFDRLVMILQQLQNGLDRSVKVPVTSNTPADQLFQEFKQDISDAEAAARASESARDDSQEIANKFGDVDGAVSATEALRDEAAASEAVATDKATLATADADRAEAAADLAESFSNSAATNADIYADTAAGLAGTVEGEQFQVLSADGYEFIRYRHDAGPVATQVGRYPTSVALEDQLRASANLFNVDRVQLFPDANLVVRRYTGTSTFNDYAAGYSQTAVAEGLKVAIPAAGSSAIKHYLRTGETATGKVVASFDITADLTLSFLSVGVGFINSSGDYIAYVLGSPDAGIVRKLNGYGYVDLSGSLATYGVGDNIEFSVGGGVVEIRLNGTLIHTQTLLADEFTADQELLIAQGGFGSYVTKLDFSADPIRDYVKQEIANSRYMHVDLNANSSLTVYTPSASGKYVGYPLERVVNAGINYDCWSFIGADEFELVDGSMVSTGRFPDKIIATSSVQEAPWKETPGATDFISGVAHGDENTESLVLIIDGETIEPTTQSLFAPAKSVRMIVTSIIQSNITPGQQVIRRKRIYDFDERGMSLDQQNTFLTDKSFTILYHNATGHADVFTSYMVDQELSVLPLDGVERSVAGDLREYTVIGDGVSVKVSVDMISPAPVSPRILIAASKKVYFDMLNGGVGATTAQAGDFWRIKSRYEISLP